MKYLASIFILFCVIFASNTWSQTQEQIEEARAQAQANASIPLETYIKSETNPPSRGGAIPAPSANILPFGTSLFESGATLRQRSSVNPQYLIAPGDKISVQLWGAVDAANVHTVDNQGNIFVPNVGPINVNGVQAQQLNQVVTERVKQIYTDNVNIYVNLLASTPVGVFVTGNVTRPGQYAGSASDTILFYLQQAGGILAERGSYRKIDIIRDEKVLASVDLYAFLNAGQMPAHSFKDGDVVLVTARGPSIIAEGIKGVSRSYELTKAQSSGKEIVDLVRPAVEVTHVSVTGVREQQPIARYFSLDEFSSFIVQDGDNLLFNDDLRAQVISVTLSGSFLGPSIYALDSDVRLHDLLASVPVEEDQANTSAVYILRESVKLEQQKLLDDSLDRLERSVFTAPASSDGEARLRAQEAQIVGQFIDRARNVEPLGRVVVAVNGKVSNIRLEQGDEIVIPAYSDLVNVAGEVMIPQAIVFDANRSIEDYVNMAGGFTDRANTSTYLIVHANGATTLVDDSSPWFGANTTKALAAGDQIVILPKVDSKLMQTVKDITQIIFQIAVAADVVRD